MTYNNAEPQQVVCQKCGWTNKNQLSTKPSIGSGRHNYIEL